MSVVLPIMGLVVAGEDRKVRFDAFQDGVRCVDKKRHQVDVKVAQMKDSISVEPRRKSRNGNLVAEKPYP